MRENQALATIRTLARAGAIRYTRHARERMVERGLTVMQVSAMLKNCNLYQEKSDQNGYRVDGRAPASEGPGMVLLSAHVRLLDTEDGRSILVITVMR